MDYELLGERKPKPTTCDDIIKVTGLLMSITSTIFLGIIYANIRNVIIHAERLNITDFFKSFEDIKECVIDSGICS